ncbi:MAG: endonuclease/exonuclease/phosphatase family protein [Clostridia bacterium]|nr:endonuclease/exonuclease/phosphatase family protein [Clostridia bacterium]
MKIMTFNTQHCWNYLEKRLDPERMAQVIWDCGADIVALNEMRDAGPYGAQTAELAAKTGLSHHYFAKAIEDGEGPYGNGLISRYPIVCAATIPVPDPEPRRFPNGYYETRCLLKARLANGLTVLVIHFGLNPDEHEQAVATVLAHLPEERCILMGDFNVLPDDPVLAPIRAKMRDTADCFAKPLLSFPSDQPEMKIDYIFVTPDLEVQSADIPAIVASDHRPHVAEIFMEE